MNTLKNIFKFKLGDQIEIPMETRAANQLIYQTKMYEPKDQTKAFSQRIVQIDGVRKVDFEFETECLTDIQFTNKQKQDEFMS